MVAGVSLTFCLYHVGSWIKAAGGLYSDKYININYYLKKSAVFVLGSLRNKAYRNEIHPLCW